ncbi:MAG: glycosyltransferase [Flavobacteriia bacterium]|nr:glycosyltransferase [Flavobacteriia bacterium]
MIYTKRPPVLSTVYDIIKMFKLAKKLDRQLDFKIIHCRSYISAFAGLSFKQKRNKKFIFDMRGFWADERVDGGIWNLNNPVFKIIYNYFKKKEKLFLEHADAVISLTENGKKEMLTWNIPHLESDKITVIPCCVNLDLFRNENISFPEKEQLKNKLGIHPSDFVLGYVGSVGTWYMLPEMLDFYKALVKQKPNARLLFVTGDSPDSILQKATEKGIDMNRVIIDKCLHKDVPLYVSLFDLSVFFIKPAYSKKASSPTKQGELMAMGIPVVCNSGVGDTDVIVYKYHSGIVIDTLTEAGYEHALNSDVVFDQPGIIQGAEEYFSLEQGVGRYLKIYTEIA